MARAAPNRGELRAEDGPQAQRQDAEHETVAARRQHGVPCHHREQAGDGHGGGHQELFLAVGQHGDALVRERRDGVFGNAHDGEGEAECGEHGGELRQEAADVAIGGEDFDVDHAAEEVAEEHAELLPPAGECAHFSSP